MLSSVLDTIPVRVFWKDLEGKYLGCNAPFAHDAGFSTPDELIGKDDFQMGWKQNAERYRADNRQVIEAGVPKLGFEEPETTPTGGCLWLRTSKIPLRDDAGRTIGLLGTYEDITDRRRAEERIRRLNRTLAVLSDINQTIVRERDLLALHREACRIAVEKGGFRLAWIGMLDPVTARVIPVAHAGEAGDYVEKLHIDLGDSAYGTGPTCIGPAAR